MPVRGLGIFGAFLFNMEANELRIGSYVLCKGYLTKVILIGEYGIRAQNSNTDYNCKFRTGDIKPIQLTEDILLKCGFDEIKDSDYKYRVFEIKDWGKIKLVNGILETAEYYFLDGLNYEIKYLHQLQNLYFSLTNNELTITL